MPDLFNTTNGALPPQNRPLTAPANAPTTAQQPVPQQPYAAAPPAAMAPDQSTVQPGTARDPQIAAAISIYAMQLGSDNPVEVTTALSAMESYGPAYRADVLQAVSQNLRAGDKPMRSFVLMDALVRNGGPESADKLLPLLQDADPTVRAEASKAFGRLRPAPAPTAAGPVNAGVPGVPVQPGAAPMGPAPAAATVPGQAPPHLQHIVEGFKDWFKQGDAAIEFARLSTADQIAVANAFINGPRDDNHFEKSYDMITAVLAKKVQEPGVIDVMRTMLNKDGVRTFIGAKAKLRAATALLHFGQPSDAPAMAKILVQHSFLPLDGRKILIDQIAQKPAFLNHPSMLPALVAQMHTETWEWTLAAGNALAKIKNAQARDAIGESAMFKQDSAGPTKQLWMLEFLAAHPGPYSPLTIQYLQRMAKSTNKALKKKAEELINKKG